MVLCGMCQRRSAVNTPAVALRSLRFRHSIERKGGLVSPSTNGAGKKHFFWAGANPPNPQRERKHLRRRRWRHKVAATRRSRLRAIVSLSDDSGGGGAGDETKLPENGGFKDALGTAPPQNCGNAFPDFAVNAPHLLNGGLLSSPRKGIAQFAKDSPDGSVVNMRVGSVEVAQGLREPVAHCFHHKPNVPRVAGSFPRNGQPKLEGHVETRSAWRPAVELDSREVVDREAATFYETEDAVQPAFSSRNLQGDARPHAQGLYPADVGEEELFKLLVVGKIQENFSARPCPLRVETSCAAPCWIWPFLRSGHECLPSNLRFCCRMSYRNINANRSSWPDFSPPCR